jgi:WD40 repeat protein
VDSGAEIRTFKGHYYNNVKSLPIFMGYSYYVNSVAFSPAGRYALSGSSDHTMKLWDVSSGEEVRTFKGYNKIHSVAFSQDGNYAISGSYDQSIVLWQISSGAVIRTFGGYCCNGVVILSVALSHDGRYVLSSS